MSNFIVDDVKAAFKSRDAVIQLVIVNIIVFLGLNITEAVVRILNHDSSLVFGLVSLPASLPIFLSKPWTLLSYMFVHHGFFHVFFNLILFYWVGKIFAQYLTSGKLVITYLYGGLAGGLLYLLIYNLMFILDLRSPSFQESAILIGASASVMAVVFSVSTLAPDLRINLMFIGPVKMKYFAFGALVLTTLLDFSSNTGGKIAHIGGALYGYYYIVLHKRGFDLTKGAIRVGNFFGNLFTRKKKIYVAHKNTKDDYQYNYVKKMEQERIDIILDKISRSGYDSLTKEEKEFLFKMSNKK